MNTYTKEYKDNSHVWMTPVADYAPMMIAHGCTFADFEAEHPHLAKSEYGQDLKATLDHLGNREALVIDNEQFVSEETTEDTPQALNERLVDAIATDYHKPVTDFISTVWGHSSEDAKAITVIVFVVCKNRGVTDAAGIRKVVVDCVKLFDGLVY